MTRKHFEAIAAAFKDAKPTDTEMKAYPDLFVQWLDDVHKVTDAIAEFNPNFDRGRFLVACGLEAEA